MWFTQELVQRPKTQNFQLFFYDTVHQEKKGLTGGALGGVWRATPPYTVNTSNDGKPPKRYQNGGTFRVHCFACNLDDKRPLLRGMTGDDHTLTYFSFFILFPFSISIWISFVSSCLFLVGNTMSPRFRFLLRFVQHTRTDVLRMFYTYVRLSQLKKIKKCLRYTWYLVRFIFSYCVWTLSSVLFVCLLRYSSAPELLEPVLWPRNAL